MILSIVKGYCFHVVMILFAPLILATQQTIAAENIDHKKDISESLCEIIAINPTIKLDIRYATTNNFTGKIVYPSSRCFAVNAVAKKLDAIQKELALQGLGLKIFDCYRPLSVQKVFWNLCPDQRYVAHPAHGSKHNRAAAVDLTLIDLKTGQELEMPSDFDDFSEKAHRIYKKMSPTAAKNCKRLEDIMVRYGFVGLPTEWWHFDDINWQQYQLLDISLESALLHKKMP